MEKVDIIIGAIGVAALIATGLGVALYDDGMTDYAVSDAAIDLGSKGPESATAAGTEFLFEAPNNTLSATFSVTVTTSGQANPSAAVQVTIVITGPEGTTTQTVESFQFSDGSATFELASDMWAEKPEDFSGTHDDEHAMEIAWTEPIEVKVHVDGPGANPLPLPGLDTYTASVSGTAMAFTIAPAVPDPEAA